MADIKKVAEAAGVSIATVSHVINSTRFVSEETKNKVKRAMKELDYQPNSVARSLRSQKTNTIGLIVPILPSDTSNFFFMTIAQGIQAELKAHGYHLLLSTNTTETVEDEIEQVRLLSSKRIDGLIIAPISEEIGYLNGMAAGFPVVFIDRRAKGFTADCVLADGYGGAYNAVKTLIDKGHRAIGMITGGLGITTSDERFRGYRQALQDHGIPFDSSMVKIERSNFESGYASARQLLSEHEPSALFIANNVLTMGAMRYIQEQRIPVPGKLAVIGFDDYDWTQITSPPLTVIRQPSYELGERAARVLLDRIEHPDAEAKEYRLDTSLILRGSC
ncbi:LacI family transcriptional regulator [Paenibacillus oenotherae]|uniref:LacI family transcriptional regulator n=1 Tax=Paenibacillus oenotherae TaxID=1435645 RepID=A0ABS7D8Y4_9BACL|nr:LacI family DNA-binding transcriptional regulator [Paenibacillus oenotherae]MBW7476335.1 LacI family transcriptional regulator [Paenibacillus oenotherae]